MIGALESGGRSASVDHFRQSFSARRSRVEQADPRLRALDRYDGQLQPIRPSQPVRVSRTEQTTSVSALHESLRQRSSSQGSSLSYQRDQVQFQSRISQFALGGGDTSGLESIANSLQDQPGVIGQVFEVAEALAGFNGDLSGSGSASNFPEGRKPLI